GIFDIDDVILNGLGVTLGYGICRVLFGAYAENAALQQPAQQKWQRITALVAACLLVVVGGWVFTRPSIDEARAAGLTLPRNIEANSSNPNEQAGTSPIRDLCGGTGGNGQVISVGENTITLKRKNGQTLIVNLTGRTTIKTPAGAASPSALKIGDAVTLVGG